MAIWVLFIISLILAVIIVNGFQKFYMKLMGANAMFFRAKTKIIAIIVVALLLTTFAVKIFGIQVPNM